MKLRYAMLVTTAALAAVGLTKAMRPTADLKPVGAEPVGAAAPERLSETAGDASQPTLVEASSPGGRVVEGARCVAVVSAMDADGGTKPFVGANVHLAWRDGETNEIVQADVASDGNGRVISDGPWPFHLRATAGGYLGAADRLDADANEPVQLVLAAHGQLDLKVVSPEGGPRAGEIVRVGYKNDLRASMPLLAEPERPANDYIELQLDQDGRASINPVIATMPLVVVVFDSLYGRANFELPALSSGERREETLRMKQGGALLLVVRDHLGKGLPGASVTAFRQEDTSWTSVAKAVTGPGGLAQLSGLSSGTHNIVASGWNPSSTDLYLLSKEARVTSGETSDLGELVAAAPFTEVTLSIAGEEDTSSRLVKALISPDFPRGTTGLAPSVLSTVFECALPMGRAVRIWTGQPGDWRYSLLVLRPNSTLFDVSIKSRVETLPAPGSASIVFEPTIQRPVAVISGVLAPDSGENAGLPGFVALMKDGELLEVMVSVDLRVECAVAFSSLQPGTHRLVGCLGGRYLDEQVELRLGEHVALGFLSLHDAPSSRVSALWPDGTPVEEADVEVRLGAPDAPKSRIGVIEAACRQGVVTLHLPPSMECSLVFRQAARSGSAAYTAPRGGSTQAELLQLSPDR